jgi:hypothetical protein
LSVINGLIISDRYLKKSFTSGPAFELVDGGLKLRDIKIKDININSNENYRNPPNIN